MKQREVSKFHRGPLVVAAAIAVCVSVGSAIFLKLNPDSEFDRLVEATASHPAFAAWPTGGFSPAAMLNVDLPSETAKPDAIVLESAVPVINRARLDQSIESRQQAGVGLLAVGQFDEAIERLEELAAAAPDHAGIGNDLAVAYATRGYLRHDWLDLVRALNQAERAHAIAPHLPEASFNRALLSELLLLRGPAEQAWREFLILGPSTQWEKVAQQRLTPLIEHPLSVDFEAEFIRAADPAKLDALVRARTLTAREYLTESLLPAWAAATESGQADAITVVPAAATALADSLTRVSGDSLARDVISAITQTAGRARDQLAAAHREYGLALALIKDDRIADAAAPLESAATTFANHGSPMRYLAELQLTTSLNNQGKPARAAELIEASIRAATARHYPTIIALAKWKRGVMHTFEARLEEAIRDYTDALRNFDAVGESDNAANMHNLRAEAFQLLGDYRASGAEHAEALRRIKPFDNLRVRHQILTQAAVTSLALQLPAAAARFQDALVDNAIAWKVEGAQGIAHLQRAKSRAMLGQDPSSDLSTAAEHINRIADRAFRARFETELALARAQVFATDTYRGIQAAGDALTLLRSQQSFPRMPPLLFTRARLQVRDDLAAASRDALEGIAILEEQRRQMRDRPLQMSLLEKNLEGFLLLAHIEADKLQTPSKALPYIERMRARGLLDVLPSATIGPASPLEVSRQRANVVFVCYAFDGGDLMIWTVRGGQATYTRLTRVRPDLQRHLAIFDRSIRARSDHDFQQALSAISRVIFAPIRDVIRPDDHVVFLPDGELHTVPFGALETVTGAHLIEAHTVSMAPSFTVFESVEKRAKMQSAEPFHGAVVVAPPATTGLAALPSAAQEAAEIASLYPAAERMIGAAATRGKFLERAAQYSLVHFAGHGVANHDQPAFSRLVFAGDGDAPTDLTAADIARRGFNRTRIVVLGACESAAGQVRAGEGVLSLARAFLGAGVPTVVGSLWDVDDALTKDLLTRFHRDLARGLGAAAALRAAQLSMINDADAGRRHPLAWSAFVVTGAANTIAVRSSQPRRNHRGTN